MVLITSSGVVRIRFSARLSSMLRRLAISAFMSMFLSVSPFFRPVMLAWNDSESPGAMLNEPLFTIDATKSYDPSRPFLASVLVTVLVWGISTVRVDLPVL